MLPWVVMGFWFGVLSLCFAEATGRPALGLTLLILAALGLIAHYSIQPNKTIDLLLPLVAAWISSQAAYWISAVVASILWPEEAPLVAPDPDHRGRGV